MNYIGKENKYIKHTQHMYFFDLHSLNLSLHIAFKSTQYLYKLKYHPEGGKIKIKTCKLILFYMLSQNAQEVNI